MMILGVVLSFDKNYNKNLIIMPPPLPSHPISKNAALNNFDGILS
jgi:hypothetical protein